MSFNGIYLWHCKDGMPISYDDARHIEQALFDQDIIQSKTDHLGL